MSKKADDMTLKQTYIREHIPQDKYEEFYEFCETEASNMDIENWPINFVKDLVHKFIKLESQRENSNKKKQHQTFFAYQTGNANELKELRQQIKQQRKNVSQNKQSDKIKTPEKIIPKNEQSALELLDSIFSNNNNNNNEAQFETKKYDKSFFESVNFWGVPPEDHKKQVQGSPNTAKSQVSFGNNSKPAQILNFDQVFQTGMNLAEIQPQKNEPKYEEVKIKKPQKANVQNKKVQQNINVTKSRQWKLQEIPIQDEEIPKKAPIKQRESRITQRKDEKKSDNQSKTEPKQTVKLVSVKNIKTPKISYQGQVLIKQPFSASVACFKSFQRMNFSSQKLKVTIQNYQTITRSFFSSNYIMYHLRVMPANIVCKRNLQDFQKLKNNLQGVYPGIRLPYIQKPGWLQSQTTPEYIQKQIKYLTYFLQDIFSHPQLRNSRIVEDFLTLKDHKSIKRKFQEYQKIKKVSAIQQLCLLSGEVKVQISQQNRQYNEFMVGFLSKMNNFWDSQEKILVQIDTMYDGLAQNYQRWMETVEQIQKQIKDFNKRVCFNELQSIESAFQNLSKYIVSCSNLNLHQKQFLQSNIFPLFRFEKQNMNLLNNIMNIQESLTRAYLKRKEVEKSQDNTEYLSDRLKDDKDSILQESGHITVLKHQCGYTSELAVSQSYRYFDRLSQKVVNLVSEVCKGKLGRLSQSINTITELVNA